MRRLKESLRKNQKKFIDQSIENVVTVLRNDPLFKDALRRNELIDRLDIVKDLGWPRDRSNAGITDTDLNFIQLYLEKFYGLRNERNIVAAIGIVAAGNSFHPIIDCLEKLEWDGQPRMRSVLHHFLGVEETELNYQILKMFMLGAIERLYNPGCKFEMIPCRAS